VVELIKVCKFGRARTPPPRL